MQRRPPDRFTLEIDDLAGDRYVSLGKLNLQVILLAVCWDLHPAHAAIGCKGGDDAWLLAEFRFRHPETEPAIGSSRRIFR